MITIDGNEYTGVEIAQASRTTRIEKGADGYVALNGDIHYDQIGRYIDYSLFFECRPYDETVYSLLFDKLSETGEHFVTGLPYGGYTISGYYYFSSLSDQCTRDISSGQRVWGNLRVGLTASRVNQ